MVTTPAIILRHRDMKEVDRLYTVYTRDLGKIDVYATGVRKIKSKLAPSLLPHHTLSATIIRGRNFWRFIHVRHLHSYTHILEDLQHYTLASWSCEALDALTKREASDETLFQTLIALYDGLEQKEDHAHLLQEFLDRSFQSLGYRSAATSVTLQTLLVFFKNHIDTPLKSSLYFLENRI